MNFQKIMPYIVGAGTGAVLYHVVYRGIERKRTIRGMAKILQSLPEENRGEWVNELLANIEQKYPAHMRRHMQDIVLDVLRIVPLPAQISDAE